MRDRPKNKRTVDINRVIMAWLVEWGKMARASRAPVADGTIGVTVGSSQTAEKPLMLWFWRIIL